MKIRDKSEIAEDPPNLMPLIDMVFLLLIFFLVATTFAEEERDQNVNLTEAASNQSLSSTPNQLILNIQADGTTVISGKSFEPEALAALLDRAVQDDPDKRVLIRADRDAYMKYFARTAVLCQNAGIDRLNIGYIPEASE